MVAVRALNRVDLPTLGRPTMPQLKPMRTPTKALSRAPGLAGEACGLAWPARPTPSLRARLTTPSRGEDQTIEGDIEAMLPDLLGHRPRQPDQRAAQDPAIDNPAAAAGRRF